MKKIIKNWIIEIFRLKKLISRMGNYINTYNNPDEEHLYYILCRFVYGKDAEDEYFKLKQIQIPE
jgi:hypothetical protein